MSISEPILSKVGFHAVYEKDIIEAVDLASRYGFSSVQIDTSMPQFFPEEYSRKARKEIRRHAYDRNIKLKVHTPGEDFSLQTLHPDIQQAIIKRIEEVIDLAYDIGAMLVTIHPGMVPAFTIPEKGRIPVSVQYFKLQIETLKSALSELSDYCKGKTLLCIENSPFTKTDVKVISEMLRDKRIFLAWDIAKMYGDDGAVDAEVEGFFLRRLDEVRECHLHDRTKEHGHQIIGEGFVDFEHYLNMLSTYDIEYTIEVRPIENAVKSLQALRQIIT